MIIVRYASAVCYRDCIVVFGGVDKKGEVTKYVKGSGSVRLKGGKTVS